MMHNRKAYILVCSIWVSMSGKTSQRMVTISPTESLSSEKTIPMRTGSQLIETLSNSLYSNIYYVFDELISNAYDADATVVKIEISDDKITISDDGEGMSKQGVEIFFDLGYSSKTQSRITRRLKRHTIGKFGIGKLTMATICDRFVLETIKNGKKTTAILDFSELLKNRYLHEAKIPIKEEDTNMPNGTKIILTNLKKEVKLNQLKRRIMKGMPLNPDFKVVINGMELKPEHIIRGDKFPISFHGEEVGDVTGELILSDEGLDDFAGVYIRVHKRIVNADNPDWLNSIMVSKFSSALSFTSRIYCVVDADKLDSCILANRNEFKRDSPVFQEFQELLLAELKNIWKQAQNEHLSANLDFEREIAKEVIEHQINKMVENIDPPEDWMIQYSKRKDAEKIKGIIKKIKRRQSDATKDGIPHEPEKIGTTQNPTRTEFSIDERIIRVGRKKFKFKIVTDMGRNDPECVFDTEEGVIYINANHSQYLVSRAEDSLYCHLRKAIAFELACTMANGIYTELIDKYNGMMHAEIEIIE